MNSTTTQTRRFELSTIFGRVDEAEASSPEEARNDVARRSGFKDYAEAAEQEPILWGDLTATEC